MEINRDFLNAAGKSGLLLGMVGVSTNFLTYILLDIVYGSITMIVLWVVLLLTLTIAVAIHLARKWRETEGGYVTYGRAFVFLFLMILMSGFVGLGSELLLYNFIEPDLQAMIGRKLADTYENLMLSFDMPLSQVDQIVEEMRRNATNMSVVERMKTITWRPLLNALMAAILAFFVRKEEPVFN